MSSLIPIPTIHLFPVLNRLLIELLRSLSPGDWKKPTVAKLWTVKDVAAHLLDVNMRVIAESHQYSGKPPQNINSYTDLVSYLNHLNGVWVEAMDRVSPQLITDLLETTGTAHYEYLATLDPFSTARYSVSWAGEEHSANWFHIAREYTEKWHHQQQIRHAVGKPGLITPELFYPCMDTFMRGVPHNYRNVDALPGTCLNITISGEAGSTWYLHKNAERWEILKQAPNTPVAAIAILPDIAWQFFTKAVTPEYAAQNSIIDGDEELARQVFSTISVIA
jgi:uncharacterized protein (TIGR03083 family)